MAPQLIPPVSLVTTPYKGKLYAVRCAPVNKYAFRGFQAGEVKFEGVSGSERGFWPPTE